jgi:glycosyltransferase involved in cell wall biosynthesis
MESVLNQEFTDYEYIVQDGCSKDTTMDIVKEYEKAFQQKGIAYRYVSAPDTGIYNAMNLATAKARGEWCIYMNADDSFYAPTVLQEVFGAQDYDGYDAVFGAYCRHDEKNSYVFQSENIHILPRKMPFVHQTIFIRTEVMKAYGYDEQYLLCADYDAFFKMYADGRRFKQIETVIANYSISGASGDGNIRALHETVRIQKKHAEQYPITWKRKILWKMKSRYMRVKNCIPDNMMITLRRVKAFIIVNVFKRNTM